MKELIENERIVMYLRFGVMGGYARTCEEIGRLLNMSTEDVVSLEQSAMQKLHERGMAKCTEACCV